MDLFVYGTLMSEQLMEAVAGAGPMKATKGRLLGYRVRPIAGNVVPCIIAADDHVDGVIWHDLLPEQVARLNLYEGAFGYRLAEVTIETGLGVVLAKCYMPPADIEPDGGDWSLPDWSHTYLEPALLAAKELFSHDPWPDQATLRRMWPMIEARAWSRHRAKPAPATLRRGPDSASFTLEETSAPVGTFFRYQAFEATHVRFDGQRSPALAREAFIGIDAAVVLPYDPTRDKVLLVEQFRLGPAVRHDANPWSLEAVAGIVDARETPEVAALREAQEEAGVALRHLEEAGDYYPSPGSTTDYFYTYVGLCDLPVEESYIDGLPEENEDLRLHPIGFDAAMALAQSGEITAGPLLHLLYWLAFHRDRLRAMA